MLKKEISVFLIVGGSTVLVDLFFYKILLILSFAGVDLAKAVSFIIGTIYAYFANRFWTFSHNKPKGRFMVFVVVYLLGLVANVSVNSGVLRLLPEQHELSIYAAFLIATGVSATLNFIGMKFFVFNKRVEETSA